MTISTSIPIRIKRSGVEGKTPLVSDLQTGELAVNYYDGELYTLRYRPGIGSDVVKIGGGGVKVTNVLYVTKDGSDSNTGQKLGEAKATLGGAIAAATAGTVIKVSAGTYIENNPITVPAQVSIVGDSLREVTITPQNTGNLFNVGPGVYMFGMTFSGAGNTGAVFSFDPNTIQYFDMSPYIQNCTNMIPNSIGIKIDGNYALGSIKSFVIDSYTQQNQGGIGVSITNGGYAQLVSLFTICNNIGVYCGSGGACDLTNSNSSFGTYGLVADGVGTRKYTATVSNTAALNSDTFTLSISNPDLSVSNAVYGNNSGIVTITTSTNHNFIPGMTVNISGLGFTCPTTVGILTYPSGNYGYNFEVLATPSLNTFSANVGVSTRQHYYYGGGTVKNNVIRPFDGQVAYFDKLYYTVNSISIINGGSGYINTPTVTISAPSTDWGVQAQGIANVVNGSIASIDVISSGRGYTTTPTITIGSPDVGINTSTATISLLPTYYTIKSSTPITSSGICTITLNDNVPYVVGVGSTVPFFKQSRILASGHSFEYIGSGNNLPNCLPSLGGVGIQDNETDSRNGGLVVYTSTDQSGNFRIGDGVKIDQSTGTISGNIYSKSLFSTMTPFILALGGGL
jgi:hypothetical protein